MCKEVYRAMPYPTSADKQDQRLMWALTILWTVFLIRYLPNVSWFTPGSAGRYETLLYLLIFGFPFSAWRPHSWPMTVGGVGLVLLLTSTAAPAANPGG